MGKFGIVVAPREKAGTFDDGGGYNFARVSVNPTAQRATIEQVGAVGETLHRAELVP